MKPLKEIVSGAMKRLRQIRIRPPKVTHEIAEDGQSILCLNCERRSFNKNDIAHLFCGNCGHHPIRPIKEA